MGAKKRARERVRLAVTRNKANPIVAGWVHEVCHHFILGQREIVRWATLDPQLGRLTMCEGDALKDEHTATGSQNFCARGVVSKLFASAFPERQFRLANLLTIDDSPKFRSIFLKFCGCHKSLHFRPASTAEFEKWVATLTEYGVPRA